MKEKLPKNILIPFLFGMAFSLFIFLGINADHFSGNMYLNVFAILLGVVVLYGSLLGIINNKYNLLLGIGGFQYGKFFFILIFLTTSYFFQRYFWTETPEYKSLLEKEHLVLEQNFSECHKIKYGKFLVGFDTIIRSRNSEKNIEKVIGENGVYTYTIRWLDSCSYYRIDDRSGAVKGVVKLGNFEGSLHDIYIKPAALHHLDEESILKVLSLEINDGHTTGY